MIVVPVRLLVDNGCNSDGFAVQAQRGLTDFPVNNFVKRSIMVVQREMRLHVFVAAPLLHGG